MCFMMNGCKYIADAHPKRFANIVHPAAIGLVLVGTVLFFSLEMFYILPMIYDPNGLFFKIAWLIALFIVYNLLGNMLACHHTSSEVTSLPKDRQIPSPEEEHLWHFCDHCQMLVPPRSWHCKLCKCCILRRDHHCIFTATCIGHNNYRYFFWFTMYMLIGSFLSLATHIHLLLINEDMRGQYAILHITHIILLIKPISFEAIALNISFIFNIYACILPLIMLGYQIPALYLNTTFYTLKDRSYNQGLRRNFMAFMGKRGLCTFFSPHIRSPLPHDGTQWQTKPSSSTV
ncbi:probable palmitoyltransferase ZDHHC24 [Drosophila santomea]|uniref:probable palmitoyltransferase ZDHHC24 n=1 Tax=Drosophila santomea TaxID=129105 RepID=UPI001CCC88EF|nr:probable palmitoyltransferase ZDHHC24 [Drosophila santomea]